MSYPVYQVPAGDVLPIFFSSYGKTNGESITLTGLAVTDIEIYKDGGATQRASDAGYTLLDTDGIDFDGITGIHGFSIDTGDNTDAGFYTVGAWFHVVVSAVTVDSQTVNFVAAVFRIMAAEDAAGVPDVNVTHFGGSAGTFASGRAEVNTSHVAGTAQTAGDLKASLNTIDDFLDTEIADILTDTGTTIDDLVDDLEARLTAALASRLAAHSLAVLELAVGSGSTTTAVKFNTINGGAPSSVDDFYNGRVIVFTSGALAGQATSITDYTGATTTATVPALTGAPANGVTAVIV
jgi:hypothetical protein